MPSYLAYEPIVSELQHTLGNNYMVEAVEAQNDSEAKIRVVFNSQVYEVTESVIISYFYLYSENPLVELGEVIEDSFN